MRGTQASLQTQCVPYFFTPAGSAFVEYVMDVDCHDALQRIAAHTLIVAERCKDRRIQAKLVDIANELIEMMVGRYSPADKPERSKLN